MKSTKNDPEEAADRKWECRRVGATTRGKWRHDDDDGCEDQPTAAILFHREEKQSQDIDHR